MKEHNEDLPEDYLHKSKMWKDRVWAAYIEISAAANFLHTDIYTYTEIPDKTQHWRVSSFLQAAAATINNHDYSAIYLDHSTGNHYDCVQSLTSI